MNFEDDYRAWKLQREVSHLQFRVDAFFKRAYRGFLSWVIALSIFGFLALVVWYLLG